MEQFVVPQFIEVEDKIFGPITTRQFLIMLAAGMFIFLAYRFGDFQMFVFVLLLIGGLSLVFAFVKVNGQTFHYFILNIIQSVRRPSLRIWRKDYSRKELDVLRKMTTVVEDTTGFDKKPVKRQRVRDLALLVNTGGFYKPEEEEL